MLFKAFLFVFFSTLLAVSEAAATRSQTKAAAPAPKGPQNRVISGRISKNQSPSQPSSNKTPVVPASKFTTDPKKNPLAKDPTKPVGTKENPAAVHYNPKTQGDQSEIIKQNPALGKPVQLDTAANRKAPTDIRKERYAAHGPAKPGQSKEDQLPASFGDKPGRLYNVNPSEQEPQRQAIVKANREARKTDAYVQQVVYSGSHGKNPDPLPKKTRRALLVRSLLARAIEESGIPGHLARRAALPELYERFSMDAAPILSY